MKKFLLIALLIISQFTFAGGEGIGLGASAAYNPQTKGFALGFRANLKPSSRFRIIPQALYYPAFPFNDIHEYHIGIGLEADIIRARSFNIYPLAHIGYNSWLNANESQMKTAKTSSTVLEVGGGIIFTKACLRPFIEGRYNATWKESSVHVGLLFVFNCKKGGRNSKLKNKGKRRKSPVSCPAYY